MTVPVQAEPSFTPGTCEVLLEGKYVLTVGGRSYDVAPAGQRFLMIEEADGSDETSAPSLIRVQNSFEDLKRLVPLNRV